MTIINCTPHAINFRVDGIDIIFQPSGIVPRVETVEAPADSISYCPPECDGKDCIGCSPYCQNTSLPCVSQVQGEVKDLPDPKEGTFYIVSGMVFAATNRKDVIAPDTGKTACRNAAGQIEAVTRFLRNN